MQKIAAAALLAVFLPLSLGANSAAAADATTPVKVVMDATVSNWAGGDSDWQDIFKVANSRYSLAIARGGACQEKSPNGSPAQIAQDLRAPADRRYERGGANR